ncbi:MAG: hypothetical protein SFY95_12145 [Planctomycetota bacterium]|nr:hypothetical protein [Planctomycetota bacterium]
MNAPRFNLATVGLIALAIVLSLGLATQARRVWGTVPTSPETSPLALLSGTPAFASGAFASGNFDVAARVGEHSMLTVAGGNGDDLLLVLDGRTEELFVYRIFNGNSLQYLQKIDVARMFLDARIRSVGTP